MADSQHSATVEDYSDRSGLALAVADPADLPGVHEWTVWIGPVGANPVGSDDGTLVGYGSTKAAALAMAKCRLVAVLELLRSRYSA